MVINDLPNREFKIVFIKVTTEIRRATYKPRRENIFKLPNKS